MHESMILLKNCWDAVVEGVEVASSEYMIGFMYWEYHLVLLKMQVRCMAVGTRSDSFGSRANWCADVGTQLKQQYQEAVHSRLTVLWVAYQTLHKNRIIDPNPPIYQLLLVLVAKQPYGLFMPVVLRICGMGKLNHWDNVVFVQPRTHPILQRAPVCRMNGPMLGRRNGWSLLQQVLLELLESWSQFGTHPLPQHDHLAHEIDDLLSLTNGQLQLATLLILTICHERVTD
jgi:hypothetical protein